MRNLVLLLALLSACSKPQPEGGATTTGGAPTASASAAAGFDIEGFCEQVMALPKPRRCEGQDAFAEGNKAGFCGTMLRASRDSGRISFDEAAAKRCVAAVDQARAELPGRRYLSDLAARFEDCRKVASGRQQAGADCNHGMECSGALVCLDGKCRPPAKAGAECRQLSDKSLVSYRSSCAAGHHCKLAGSKAEQGTCQPLLAAGGACEHSGACAAGLRCRAGKCAAGRAFKAGEGCTASADCEAGLYCSPEQPRRCAPRKKAGEACGGDEDCRGRCSRQAGSRCVSYCGSG